MNSKMNSKMITHGSKVQLATAHLKNMRHCPIIYLGEIGSFKDYQPHIITLHKSQIDVIQEFPNLEMYKFGQSTNIYRRLVLEHRQKFKYFDIKLLRESYRHQEVERIIQRELFAKNLLLRVKWDNRIQREIMFFREEKDKLWYKNMVDDLVHQRLQQTKFVDIDLFH